MPAQRGADRRQRLGRVAAVEDERDVRRAGVLLDPVDDRVPADLLLRVDREADVDRQLARRREELVARRSMKRCALSSATPRATRLPSRSTSVQGSDSQSSSGSGGCTSRWA